MEGRYQIGRLLGKGAMGQVFLARDTELGRDVALKFLQGDQTGIRFERLRREAELCARLTHPGIVRLHGTTQIEGREALVYELVPDARSLSEAWANLALRARVSLVRDAARALGHAHSRGVVHRDIKPENLLVAADGALKVADFGLAAAADLERLTQTGALVGTPCYMAPEQVSAGRDALGPRTDVWALGVVLYEAIRGEPPFSGAGLVELAARILRDTPDALPPEAGDLARVCEVALNKTPRHRYPDAEALAEDLDRWLDGASAPSPGRRPWLALASVAVAVGVAVAYVSRARSARPAAASVPSPTVTSSESASLPTPVDPAEAAWLAIAELGSGKERLERGHQWLLDHPGHPRLSDARDLVLPAGAEGPLWTVEVVSERPARVGWDGQDVCVASGQVMQRRSLSGELVAEWPLETEHDPVEVLSLSGGILAHASVFGLQLCLPDGQRRDWSRDAFKIAAASAQGDWLALGARSGRAILVLRSDPPQASSNLQRVIEIALQHPHVLALSFADERRLLIATTASHERRVESLGTVWAWNTADWTPRGRAPLAIYPNATAVSRDGRSLAVGSSAGQILRYRLADLLGQRRSDPAMLTRELKDEGAILRLAAAHKGHVEQLAYAPGGARLYSLATHDTRLDLNELIAWRLPEGRPEWVRELPGKVWDMKLSEDGRHLALGYRTGRVELMVVDW